MVNIDSMEGRELGKRNVVLVFDFGKEVKSHKRWKDKEQPFNKEERRESSTFVVE